MPRTFEKLAMRLMMSAALTTAAATCQSYSISGTVTNTFTNAPLEGAPVTLDGPPSGTVLTNAAGFYQFTGLPNGSYALVFGPSFRFRSSNLGAVFNNLNSNQVVDFPVTPRYLPTLVLQNQNSNDVSIWLLGANGQSIFHAPVVATAAANWRVVGSSDFNRDGVPDVLLQNQATNGISIWYMGGSNGTTLGLSPQIGASSANWQVVTSGDLNEDGTPDILLQNSVTNQLSIWYMTGANGSTVQSAPVVASPLANWRAVGTADFDQNGAEDIVFQNTATNGVSIWYRATGSTMTLLSAPVVETALANWTVVGVSFVNNDAVPDIVLQNTASNQISAWLMGGQNGAQLTSTPYLPTPANGWRVRAGQ